MPKPTTAISEAPAAKERRYEPDPVRAADPVKCRYFQALLKPHATMAPLLEIVNEHDLVIHSWGAQPMSATLLVLVERGSCKLSDAEIQRLLA